MRAKQGPAVRKILIFCPKPIREKLPPPFPDRVEKKKPTRPPPGCGRKRAPSAYTDGALAHLPLITGLSFRNKRPSVPLPQWQVMVLPAMVS